MKDREQLQREVEATIRRIGNIEPQAAGLIAALWEALKESDRLLDQGVSA